MFNKFTAGVIEGFFGNPWQNDIRLLYPKWLKEHGYDFFIYAPKNDGYLRKHWKNTYTKPWINYLARLAKECKQNNIFFGIGFSPLGATSNIKEDLPLLKKQITELYSCVKPDILAILFDDLKIDRMDEAYKQNEILHSVIEIINNFDKNSKNKTQIITCPSYYSIDPILEKVFGKKPLNYHKNFMQDLPLDLDIFWTGSKVISEQYSVEDISLATELLGRKPFIWDNYPVNDGKKASEHLYLESFSERSTIPIYTSGIAVNPMKQPCLSKIPLATLPISLKESTAQQREQAFINSVYELCSNAFLNTNCEENKKLEFSKMIINNANYFKTVDQSLIPQNKITELLSIINGLPKTELTNEFSNFLLGKFAFDPNCLTG